MCLLFNGTVSGRDLGRSFHFMNPAAVALAASPGATPVSGPGGADGTHFFVLSLVTSVVSLATSVACFLNSYIQAAIDLSVLA